ncbi:unnamed protein product [Rotaria sp. Silwood2]|nr:unnamed protein product [Rotaria sp. Silwood2]CAF4439813.1 unnamed protein product [Rotaria sp. Silwood2]
MYLFSSLNNEELSSKDETTNSIINRLSMCSIAAASRLMSSVSKKSRNSILKESNDTNEKFPLSKPFTSKFSSFLIKSSSTIHSSSANPIIPT